MLKRGKINILIITKQPYYQDEAIESRVSMV
jgi:hypothetical protein